MVILSFVSMSGRRFVLILLTVRVIPLYILFLSTSKVKQKWTKKYSAVKASTGQFTAHCGLISFYHNVFAWKEDEELFPIPGSFSVVLVQPAGQLMWVLIRPLDILPLDEELS